MYVRSHVAKKCSSLKRHMDFMVYQKFNKLYANTSASLILLKAFERREPGLEPFT